MTSLPLCYRLCLQNLYKKWRWYKDEELDKYGVNNSLTHVDFMIGSNDMNIVGITHQGEEVQVFKDGTGHFKRKKTESIYFQSF